MKVKPPALAAYGSVLIETKVKSMAEGDEELLPLGWGTAFLWKIEDKTFLVTNWHVLTGRHPERPSKNLPGYKASPSHIQMFIPNKDNPKHFLPGMPISLYDGDGAPSWIEPKTGFGIVDLAAIPIELPQEALWPSIQEFAPCGDKLYEPGADVCIVGFPFDRAVSVYPIWKRAMIASEPSIALGGRPMMFLDAPGRAGMSGSPVYFISDGIGVDKETYEIMNDPELSDLEKIQKVDAAKLGGIVKNLEFAGVYSGSLGDQDLAQLSLGRFWGTACVQSMFANWKHGENPYPPV